MQEKCLYVGYSKAAITPPLGIHIPGHGFAPRLSEGVIDALYVHAIAFSDGENKAVFFNADAIGVENAGGQRIREKVAAKCGVPVENVFIAATHCHTAMWIGGDLGAPEPEGSYYGRQDDLFCEAAQAAMADLKPATMKIARGELRNVGFIRRYKMKDGSFKTNPKNLDPNIDAPDGEQDNSLQLVRFVREGGREVVIVNFGTHPDVVSGKQYTPDWPGFTADIVKAGLEGNAEVVFVNGFGGDSNECNRFLPKPDITKYALAKRIARKVSGEALKIYDDVWEIPAGKVQGFTKIATFGKNPHEEWEVPIAQKIVASGALADKEIPEELQQYKMSVKKARRILENLKRTEDFNIPMYALQVGNLCFVGAPGEPFCETGMNIKNRSKMDMTICTCRTNGSNGYFPTRRAYVGGGYERDYTAFGPDCAESIENAALEMIEEMERNQI